MKIRVLAHTSLAALAFGLVSSVALNARAAEPEPTVAPDTGTAAPATAPNADAVKEAGKRYESGLALYSEGEFKLAAIEFERAYSVVPDYRVLYNIGQVRIQLGEYARARRALEQYLKEGGDKVSQERRTAVEADLQMLAGRTATLAIVTNTPGAEIVVDDRVVGTAPLAEPLLLDAGEHRVLVRAQGREPKEQRITLAGLDSADLSFDLEKTRDRPLTIVQQVKSDEKSNHTTWMWASWSATGTFAIGATVTGLLGIKAANELDDLRGDPKATRSNLDSSQRRARTLLLAADVLGAAALAAGGVALYVTLSGDDTEKPKPKPGPRVQAAVGPSFTGVRGSF
jgi:tetratricopeptide (TPR) repeat protein